jgi:hypothetical protein
MHQFATEAATMAYNLATAALATGVNKSTILRAIKAGRLSATRDETGWTIEVAELHRVFAPLPAAATAEQPRLQRDATTDELVRLLREQLPDMRVIAIGPDAAREAAARPRRRRERRSKPRALASGKRAPARKPRGSKADVFSSRRENRANRKAAGALIGEGCRQPASELLKGRRRPKHR